MGRPESRFGIFFIRCADCPRRIITYPVLPLGVQVRSGEVLVKFKIEGGDGTCISSILGVTRVISRGANVSSPT